MLRTVVVRNVILKETFKKAVRFNALRSLSVECSRRRHKYNQPNLFKISSKKQWIINPIRFYSSLPPHFKVKLPALSPTMDTGTLVSWEKKEGDKLNDGDLLAEIETDKATMGFETPEEGYLAKIIVPAGTKNIPLGKVVCIIVSKQEDVAAFKDFKMDAAEDAPAAAAPAPAAPAPAAPVPAAPAKAPTPAPAAPAPAPTAAAGGRVYASPMAKTLAEKHQIRLQGKGSGMFDSITSKDLDSLRTQKAASPAPSGAPAAPARGAPVPAGPKPAFVDIPLTGMRTTIAKRLVFAKQSIPHYYLQIDINMQKLLSLRKQFNHILADEKVKLSLNDFIIKAVAVACKRVPDVNSSWMDTHIRQYSNVDVGVAVATEKGLYTPIIFNADSKGLLEISTNVKSLAKKAREGKLKPNEFQGGTVCVSNLGMYAVKSFSAVVNPPHACILAVGSMNKKLILDESSEKGFKEIDYIVATGSFDHRVIDGAVGAEWLAIFRDLLEDPQKMIL